MVDYSNEISSLKYQNILKGLKKYKLDDKPNQKALILYLLKHGLYIKKLIVREVKDRASIMFEPSCAKFDDGPFTFVVKDRHIVMHYYNNEVSFDLKELYAFFPYQNSAIFKLGSNKIIIEFIR